MQNTKSTSTQHGCIWHLQSGGHSKVHTHRRPEEPTIQKAQNPEQDREYTNPAHGVSGTCSLMGTAEHINTEWYNTCPTKRAQNPEPRARQKVHQPSTCASGKCSLMGTVMCTNDEGHPEHPTQHILAQIALQKNPEPRT